MKYHLELINLVEEQLNVPEVLPLSDSRVEIIDSVSSSFFVRFIKAIAMSTVTLVTES